MWQFRFQVIRVVQLMPNFQSLQIANTWGSWVECTSKKSYQTNSRQLTIVQSEDIQCGVILLEAKLWVAFDCC